MANPFKSGCAFLVSLFLISCAKQKDCYATIVCKEGSGAGLDSVVVELYSYVKGAEANTTPELKGSGMTDETGRISFGFKVPALYHVKTSKDTLSASSIIQLEEGKEVQMDLILK
jgi:hypothetical protein